jgi:hypothetical protein
LRWLSLGLAAVTLAACTSSSSTTNATPADFYAAVPSLSVMRQVLGDNSWWPMPPSFAVPPLDANRLPADVRYSVTQSYLHVGTQEQILIDYTVLTSSAIASAVMTFQSSAQASPTTTPKLGDSSLYIEAKMTGAAPFESDVFVKVSSTIIDVGWLRKDGYAPPAAMAALARPAVSRVKDLLAGKIHASPPVPADEALLPPPGFNITLLGYTRVPTETAVLDLGISSDPELVTSILKDGGVKDALYGDYVLNADTHMEVKVILIDFGDPTISGQWLDLLRGNSALDSNGIFSTYEQTLGRYFYAFTAGGKSALLTCQSTGITEAASRSCELPLESESAAWKLSLGG